MSKIVKFVKDYRWTVGLITLFALIPSVVVAAFLVMNIKMPDGVLETLLPIFVPGKLLCDIINNFIKIPINYEDDINISTLLFISASALVYACIGYLLDKKHYKVGILISIIIFLLNLLFSLLILTFTGH